MKKPITYICILLLILSWFFQVISFDSESSTITSFSDLTTEKTISFPRGGGTDLSATIEIPKKAFITNASFDVETLYDGLGNYPLEPSIDVGDDGDSEWAFIGPGYGEYGRQNVFADDLVGQNILFDANKSYDNQVKIIMPKNATVSSTSLNVRGSGAGKILMVTDGANSYGVNLMIAALKNIGNSVTLVKETTLPINWSDPNEYNAIFWIGEASSSNGPSSSIINNFVNYVKTGGCVFMCGAWIDYTGSYSGTYEIPFFEWALHHTWGNRWGGGGSGIGTTNKYTHQSNTTHPVFNTPNTLPSYWNNLYTGTFWHSPSATINNGSIIGKVDTTTTNPKYNAIIAWDGLEYNPAYGKTLMVRQPIASSWYNITQGDVLTNFTENVGTWFTGQGKAANVTIDIGDNGGLPEFDHSGELNGVETVPDFTGEMNTLISSLPVSFIDNYGIEFVEIPVNVTNDEEGMLLLANLDIRYNLTTKAFLNPNNNNLINELNELVPDTGEGNIIIPLAVSSSSQGKINITNILIEYSLPELTNDRLLLLNDHIPNYICFADYKNYTFLINITNIAGVNDVKNVTFILDADGDQIKVRWTRIGNVFEKLFDPNDLIELNVGNCISNILSPVRWSLEFNIRFTWNNQNENLKRCAINTTNETGAFAFDYFEDVYRIENDLDLIGTLEVTAQDQGVLNSGDWVHASEAMTWGNLTAVYEGTTDIYPDDKNFNISVTDDDTGEWIDTASSAETFQIVTYSDSISDYSDLHHINIKDIPGFGADVSMWSFMIKTDNTGPLITPNVICHADSPTDPETNADNDDTVYVVWGASNDQGGSGIKHYAMEFNNDKPMTISNSGSMAIGAEGLATFYVRAQDNVGNWGTVNSASIYIDLTELSFIQPVPDPNVWQNTLRFECGISIQDIGGSGVSASSIQYRSVDSGEIQYGSWRGYDIATSSEFVSCRQNITFESEGTGKKVQWRAKDLAGNGYVYSKIYEYKIDSTPVSFNGFSVDLDHWLNDPKPNIDFYINDTNPFGGVSSGIDINSIKYSFSDSGIENYGDWIKISCVGVGEHVKCNVMPTFSEGDQNYLRFTANDIAGNPEMIEYQVKVDLTNPQFSEPLPVSTTWHNSARLQCNVTITDDLSEVDVKTIKYSISTNGTTNYGKWCKISLKHLTASEYHTVTVSCNDTFKEGKNNYIKWLAYDSAGNSFISDDYRIRVDLRGCTFHEPTPVFDTWSNDLSVKCSIIINDTLGSGVDIDTIEYGITTNGFDNVNKWENYGLKIIDLSDTWNAAQEEYEYSSIQAEVTVDIFNEGIDNFIYWRVKDIADNDYLNSGPNRIKIDISPVNFFNPLPKPDIMLYDYGHSCRISVRDLGGSGVDPSTIEYRYSTTGLNDYTPWSNEGISTSKKIDHYDFLVYLSFEPGIENYYQWRASDIAGNGPFETEDYNLIINSPPVPVISSPNIYSDYYVNGEITFDAQRSSDFDFGDELSFYWFSNITGPFGFSDNFRAILEPGMHHIVLYASDSHNHNVSTYVNITVNRLDLDEDNIPDLYDKDIDGDGHLNIDDIFPWDKKEWLDTDYDSIGDNSDDDDDNDGHIDSEDEYPLDDTRWENVEEHESELLFVLIIIIFIVIIIIILIILVFVRQKKKKTKEKNKVPENNNNTPNSTQISAPITTVQPFSPLSLTTPPPFPGQYNMNNLPYGMQTQPPLSLPPTGRVVPVTPMAPSVTTTTTQTTPTTTSQGMSPPGTLPETKKKNGAPGQ